MLVDFPMLLDIHAIDASGGLFCTVYVMFFMRNV